MSRRSLYWTVQTLGWGAVVGGFAALALATGNGGVAMAPGETAAWAVATWALLVGGSHALRALIRRGRWLTRGPLALGVRLVAGAFGVAAGAQIVSAALFTLAGAVRGEPGSLEAADLAAQAGTVPLVAALLLAWSLAYVLVQTAGRLRAAEREALALRAALAEAELATLRAQVNPHFLFNALNTVRALVREDPEAARRAVTRLSTLLRATLAAGPGEHPLAAELDLARAYLDLEGLRFEERLAVEIDVPDAALGVAVPTLLLLTLVENAVKHGVAGRPEGGAVRVEARLADGTLRLRVENPPAPAGAAPDGTGTGLRTARERLALLHGAAARLDADVGAEAGRPAVVTVTLPASGAGAAPDPGAALRSQAGARGDGALRGPAVAARLADR